MSSTAQDIGGLHIWNYEPTPLANAFANSGYRLLPCSLSWIYFQKTDVEVICPVSIGQRYRLEDFISFHPRLSEPDYVTVCYNIKCTVISQSHLKSTNIIHVKMLWMLKNRKYKEIVFLWNIRTQRNLCVLCAILKHY